MISKLIELTCWQAKEFRISAVLATNLITKGLPALCDLDLQMIGMPQRGVLQM
jgi:hypothetical protein